MAIVSNEALKYTEYFENDASGQPIYQGWADSHNPDTTLAIWRIARFTYVNGGLTKIEWAEGTQKFDYIWDNRDTAYTYK